MKHRRVVWLLVLIAVALFVYICYMYRSHAIRCSLVFTHESWTSHGTWDILTEQGFSPTAIYIDSYEEYTGESAPAFFYEHGQTFVVCNGYMLEKLYYREADMSGRWMAEYPFYNVRAELRPMDTGLVYIYKVDAPVRIERDHHSNDGADTKIVK